MLIVVRVAQAQLVVLLEQVLFVAVAVREVEVQERAVPLPPQVEVVVQVVRPDLLLLQG
jgi:hypothetical protein